MTRPYQQCSKTVMDTIGDDSIIFDSKGISNYYYDYLELERSSVITGTKGKEKLAEEIQKIRESGQNKKYDCILGLSGGIDSSYLAYLAKENGLRPLVVHFDNGWNSELAVKNIQNILTKLDFDLKTFVIDWEQFRELQKAYFKASVVDVEVPTDQLIFSALQTLAIQNDIKYILSGWNTVTEAIMPPSWNYRRKFDSINLRDIHMKHGKGSLNKLPILSTLKQIKLDLSRQIEIVALLNYIPYNKKEIKTFLMNYFDWKDYGGKHYESVFTRFYQGYYLPKKFNIDKRKAHLSTLICSGQITRQEALAELEQPTYPEEMQKSDLEYIKKKLNFSELEFQEIMNAPIRKHTDYKTDQKVWDRYFELKKSFNFLKFLRVFRRS